MARPSTLPGHHIELPCQTSGPGEPLPLDRGLPHHLSEADMQMNNSTVFIEHVTENNPCITKTMVLKSMQFVSARVYVYTCYV